MDPCLGIDFGTWKSTAAVAWDDHLDQVPVPARPDEFSFPTAAYYVTERGETKVCQEAEELGRRDQRNFFAEFKSDLRNQDELLDGIGITCEGLVAAIIKHLKAVAQAQFPEREIQEVVVTIPADGYGNSDERRQIMKRAAQEARFKSVSLVPEPAAAACHYAHEFKEEDFADGRPMLVYDLGYAAFNSVIVRRLPDRWEIEPPEFGIDYGAKNLEEKIFSNLQEKLKKMSAPVSAAGQAGDIHFQMKQFYGDVMKRFANPCADEFLGQAPPDGKYFYDLSLQDFRKMMEPLLDYTKKCCERSLDKLASGRGDISRVLLVGGACNIPFVQEKLEDWVGRRFGPDKHVKICNSSPEFAVSRGAALWHRPLPRPAPPVPPTPEVEMEKLGAAFQAWQIDMLKLLSRS